MTPAFPSPPLHSRHAGNLLRWLLIAVLALLGTLLLAHGSDTKSNFAGHYELAEAKADRSFTLDITQVNRRVDITFSAAMNDGSGAAPDGEGHGRVEDGVLSFTFKDSFNNEGTCKLSPTGSGYRLNMTIDKVVDVGPVHFYGDMSLRKTSSKPGDG